MLRMIKITIKSPALKSIKMEINLLVIKKFLIFIKEII